MSFFFLLIIQQVQSKFVGIANKGNSAWFYNLNTIKSLFASPKLYAWKHYSFISSAIIS